MIGTAIVMSACASFTAGAQSWTFDTAEARMTVDSRGIVSSLINKQSGQEELNPAGQAVASVSIGGRTIPATSFACTGNNCRLTFGESGISADYQITTTANYFIFKVVALHGSGISKLTILQLNSTLSNSGGRILAVRWDNSFSLGLIGLTQDVETAVDGARISASAYPEFGVVGKSVVLVAQSADRFLGTIKQIENTFHLISPQPTIDGVWSKESPAASSNYLFTNITEANADDVIRFAEAGHFPYILIQVPTWAGSLGSYPVHQTNYPHGEQGLKAVVDKCHAAGIRVGLHMLTSEVSKHDGFVQPVPDPGLLKAEQSTLAQPLSTVQTSMVVQPPLKATGSSVDVQIDSEILHCTQVQGVGVTGCQRGYNRTGAAPHRAGTTVFRLYEANGGYLADLRSPLSRRITARISHLVNDLGFDMVDFDGGELNAADGPYWYWVSVQQNDIWTSIKRNVLVQGSGITPWSWHFFTRGLSDDRTAVDVKSTFQQEKINFAWKLNHDAFLPADVGWVGLYDSTPDHPATMPDQIELFAVRGLALNSGIGLESQYEELKGNGRTAEMLGILSAYQKLQESVTASQRAQLSSGEWHLGAQGKLYPAVYHEEHGDLSSGIARVMVPSQFETQPLRFRVRADPAPVSPNAAENTPLVRAEIAAVPPAVNQIMPGALIREVPFEHPLNLLDRRALAVRLSLAGSSPPGKPSVLNVQLRDTSGNLRDYYVDLDFGGTKTVVVSAENAERLMSEFWPSGSNYSFKSALGNFNYGSVQGLSVRWMRIPRGINPQCKIEEIAAIMEQRGVLKDVTISDGNSSIRISGVLRTGDYAEYWGDNRIRVFDGNNFLLRSVDVGSSVLLKRGANNFGVSAASGTGPFTFIAIELGPALN